MKPVLNRSLSTLAVMGALFAPAVLPGQTAAPQDVLDSVRFVSKAEGCSELQTAVVSFQNAEGVTVDLVSAVHIGDAAYYRQLNQLLAGYEVVLYEMVGGPVEARSQAAAAPEVGVTNLLQRVMQSMLGLRYQLDGINYHQPNFVHADADWKQWQDLMAARNQNMATLFLRALEMQDNEDVKKAIESMKGEEAMTGLLSAVTKFNPETFKRTLAPLLSESERFIQTLESKEGTVLISERNKIAMGVVQDHVRQGRKHLAVFYGAAHMPDFKQRLEAAGFTERRKDWVTAWSIGNGDKAMSGLDLMETVLKDDKVIEGVFSFFRQFAGPGAPAQAGAAGPEPEPQPEKLNP